MDLHVLFYNYYEGHHIYHAYLNALYISKKNGGVILTHQEYIDADLYYDNAYFEVFNMERILQGDKDKIRQKGIPRSFFDELAKKYRSRTQSIIHLFKEREEYIERILTEVLDETEHIDRIFVFGEVYESIKHIAQERNIDIITYEFSTVRAASGYTLNLMQACNGNLYFNDELKQRYERFRKEMINERILSRTELISLFVPQRQLKYIPLISAQPIFEVGILNTAYHVIAPFCRVGVYTDDDILYECNQRYKSSEIKQRRHPGSMKAEDLERATADKDTLPFILSCKRIASVSSNALFETMLWGRTAISASDAIAFSFMCETDYSSNRIVDEMFLNFYLINALVPTQELLFSCEYWKQRNNMTEKELYYANLDCIFETLSLKKDYFEKDNLTYDILYARGVKDISTILSNREFCIPYFNALESKLVVTTAGNCEEYRCINFVNQGKIRSIFKVKGVDGTLLFYPHEEKTGFIRINRVSIGDEVIYRGDENFIFVMKGEEFSFSNIEKKEDIVIEIEWEEKENTIYSVKIVSDEVKALKEQIDIIQNSYSWKFTKPLRAGVKLIKKI